MLESPGLGFYSFEFCLVEVEKGLISTLLDEDSPFSLSNPGGGVPSSCLGTQRVFVTISCYLSVTPRFARHFVQNGTNRRHLFKVFGIRFDILVDGKVSVPCEGMAAKALS